MSSHFIEKPDDTLDPERFAPLGVRQLMPTFGARIEGVDLTDDLSDETRTLLRDAWLAYGVIILTGQRRWGPDEHLAAASIFGTPDLGSRLVEKLTPQVDVITTDESRPPVTNLWHADNTTLEAPSLGTMIQIQECPPVGGNTSWASTKKAYRCLSDRMKGYLDGLTAVHYWDGRGHREPIYLTTMWDEESYSRKVRENPPGATPSSLSTPSPARRRCTSTRPTPPTSRGCTAMRATPSSASCTAGSACPSSTSPTTGHPTTLRSGTTLPCSTTAWPTTPSIA